jgi:hypothetical protein
MKTWSKAETIGAASYLRISLITFAICAPLAAFARLLRRDPRAQEGVRGHCGRRTQHLCLFRSAFGTAQQACAAARRDEGAVMEVIANSTGVYKRFGAAAALDGLDLEVRHTRSPLK